MPSAGRVIQWLALGVLLQPGAHGSRTEHPQAFASLKMTTPDGSVLDGQGCFESIVIGRHAPSGFTSMFDVP